MRRALLLAALLGGACGCDDATARGYLEAQLCSVLPYWLADCSDPAVVDKALSLFDNGIVEAKAICQSSIAASWIGTITYHYEGTRFHDGSALMTLDQSWGFSSTRFCGRSEACSGPMMITSVPTVYGYPAYQITFSIDSGSLLVDLASEPDDALDIETECTGFNLEAFGG